GNLDLSHAAQPIIRALREASGETVHLGVLREDSVVCVARELSRHSVVAVATAVGDVWPVFGSAMGAAVRSAMLGALDVASDPEAAEARARGFSIDYGRHKNGITGLAAPVFGYRGTPEGAVAVSGPEDRMSAARIDEVGVLVVRAAAELSAAIGYASSAEAAE